MPDAAFLKRASVSTIVQTYLVNEEGFTERVRIRSFEGKTVYTHTLKRRISGFTRSEDEREIDRQEYELLLKRADPARSSISKRRYCLDFIGHTLELDVFSFWGDRAILEIELHSEGELLYLPEELEIFREITSDRRYTNASLARQVPMEDLGTFETEFPSVVLAPMKG